MHHPDLPATRLPATAVAGPVRAPDPRQAGPRPRRWRRALARVAAAWATATLLGCASAPPAGPPPGAELFADALFADPAAAAPVADPFQMSPAMHAYLQRRLPPATRREGAQAALLEALYAQGELRLDYDARYTRTAAEAFDARQGNCLSLVIMTAAFARELGLQVRFREVQDSPAIEHNGQLTFVIGHVNLALGSRPLGLHSAAHDQHWLLVDFLPGQDLRRQRVVLLEEHRIRAMFLNNRAAEELALGRRDSAYAHLRAAWQADPAYANLYNTLGVLYRQHGATALAERALQTAQRLDPGNPHVAGNLAALQQPLPARQPAAAPARLHAGKLDLLKAKLRRGSTLPDAPRQEPAVQ